MTSHETQEYCMKAMKNYSAYIMHKYFNTILYNTILYLCSRDVTDVLNVFPSFAHIVHLIIVASNNINSITKLCCWHLN